MVFVAIPLIYTKGVGIMYRLKWTNKHSGETGYVQKISTKGRHFINTFDEKEAKTYKSEALANNDIKILSRYGEADNNIFEAIDIG